MKKLGILLIFAAFMGFNNSCIIELTPSEGQVVFWSDFYGPNIDVYIDGSYEDYISVYYESGSPECYESGNVTVTLPEGMFYNWDAEEDAYPYRVWNQDHSTGLNITADGCLTMRLWASSKGAEVEAGFSNGEGVVIGQKK